MGFKQIIYKLSQLIGLDPILIRQYLIMTASIKSIDLHFILDTIVVEKGSYRIILSKRHIVYCEDIIRYFDYYFNIVEPEIIDGWSVVDYSKTKRHRLKSRNLDFIFTSIPESDSTTSIYLEKARLKPGDIVFDLGAYCGSSTYVFSCLVGMEGHIFAFEPDPESFEALSENLKLHRLTNVTILPMGIWEKTSELNFQSEGNLGSSISTITGRNNHTNIVKFLSLEDAFDLIKVPKIDFIKMDIEGAEGHVIASSSGFLMKYRPRLIIEPHLIHGRINQQQICNLLHDYGYKSEIIPQAGLRLPLIYAESSI